MNRSFKLRRHNVRVVTTHDDYGSGCYRPGVHVFLTGPNGSPAGSGPKAWPLHMAIRNFRSSHAWAKTGWAKRNHGQYGWTNSFYVPLPHVKWSTGYRFRKVGGIAIYKAVYRAWKAAV